MEQQPVLVLSLDVCDLTDNPYLALEEENLLNLKLRTKGGWEAAAQHREIS